MTKATEEMLALADRIERAIDIDGEITLFETNGIRVVSALRTLAAQADTPGGEPERWIYPEGHPLHVAHPQSPQPQSDWNCTPKPGQLSGPSTKD